MTPVSPPGRPVHRGRQVGQAPPAAEMPERSAEDPGAVPFCTSHLCLPHPHSWSETRLFFPSALKMGTRWVGVGFPKAPPAPFPLSFSRCETFSPFSFQNVEDQHLLMHDQTVIRKGQ